MRKAVQGMLATMFGPSRNDQYAQLLKDLSDVGIECARFFRKTEGQDKQGVIDLEHKADRIADAIHELLDNAFIMRFDIPDAMRLTDEMDDIIDGMRKIVLHVDAYKIYLGKMRPEALALMDLGSEMLLEVAKLIDMLAQPRLILADVRAVANRIDEMESQADSMVADHERKLVEEFAGPGKDVLGFIAWHQLFHLLEQITDDANHCGGLIVSLARKEA
jgi:uncharacterized protein Yka (UPF0111/DUF47 family)